MSTFLRTATEATADIGLTPAQKKKKKYAEILRYRFPKRRLRGAQEVPMDLDKINASFDATQQTHLI